MKKIYTFGLAVMTVSVFSLSVSSAESGCSDSPDCASIGYIMSASECSGKKMIKCPWDEAMVSCQKSSWNTEVEVACGVGKVLYEDKKCYQSGKTSKMPIGVIFDTSKKLAAGLGMAFAQPIIKGTNNSLDIPELTNCTTKNYKTCDTDGKSNTQNALKHDGYNNDYYEAFRYVAQYATEGSSQGDWFLPSAAELMTLFQNRVSVDAALRNLDIYNYDDYYALHFLDQGASLSDTDYYYISSNESSDGRMLGILFKYGGASVIDVPKGGVKYVIPVLKY